MDEGNHDYIGKIYKGLAEAKLFDASKTPFILKPYTNRTMSCPESFPFLTVEGLLPKGCIRDEENVSKEYQDVFFNEYKKVDYMHSDGLKLDITSEENLKHSLKHRIELSREIARVPGVNQGLPFALVSACLDLHQRNSGKISKIDTRITFGQDFNFLKATGLDQFPVGNSLVYIVGELEKQKINYRASFNNESAINNFVTFVKNVRASYR